MRLPAKKLKGETFFEDTRNATCTLIKGFTYSIGNVLVHNFIKHRIVCLRALRPKSVWLNESISR